MITHLFDVDGWLPNESELLELDRNDTGNARRLFARSGRDLLHQGQYLAWGSKSFVGGEIGEAMAVKFAQATAAAIKDEAREIDFRIEKLRPAAETDEDVAKKVAALEKLRDGHLKFSITSGNAPRVRGMLDMLIPHVMVPARDLDADPLKLNLQNGTLALAAKSEPNAAAQLLPHNRKDKITKLAGVCFDPDAQCPLFETFLARILPDASLRRFLQVWFGYVLTGSMREQIFVICYGTGANGKSVLLSVLKHVLGEYAVTVPIETFMSDDRKRGSDATPDVVRLLGARLALASEPEVGARLSEAMVKTVTGEEAMTARQLFSRQFEFFPTFKLMLSVNIKPTVRGQDEGIWRRIALVPFEVFIPPEERDRGLAEKLKQEAPGILNWMLDGFLEWQEHGLPETPAIAAAVNEYRVESDPIGEFMRQRTRRTPGWRVRAAELHRSYVSWTERSFGDRRSAAGATAFGRRLTALGYHKATSNGVYYTDLELLPDPEATEDNSSDSTLPGE